MVRQVLISGYSIRGGVISSSSSSSSRGGRLGSRGEILLRG